MEGVKSSEGGDFGAGESEASEDGGVTGMKLKQELIQSNEAKNLEGRGYP
jgi:hypothetical protein